MPQRFASRRILLGACLVLGLSATSLTGGTAYATILSPHAHATRHASAESGPAPQNRVHAHPSLKFKSASAATIDPADVISDGTVSLGVNPTGNLIANGVGLLYAKTGNDSLEPGCFCEGWGAADPTTGTTGGADDAEGTSNVTVTSFTTTATTAFSAVKVGSELKVTHYYQPSPVKGIFKGTVTITNLSSAPAPVVYRRLMDWDVAPSTFNEMVSVVTRNASGISYSDDNGFASFDPLTTSTPILFSGQSDDAGPADQGALFDLNLGTLPAGGSVKFTLYYGAAPNKYTALTDLTRLKAEAYSLGYPDDQAQRSNLGGPNTFIFGLANVGGTPLPGAVVATPTWGGSYEFVVKSSCGTGSPSLSVTDTSGNSVTANLDFGLPVIDGASATESVGGIPDGTFNIHAFCNGTELGYATVHVGLIGAQYVALGDSYASGEGAFSYLSGSNTKTDKCHRATDGYAEQLASQLGLSLDFGACSGAVIPDFTNLNGEGNNEGPQLGHLSEQTQLVTVTIGGNDVGFAPLLTDCTYAKAFFPGKAGCQKRDQAALAQQIQFLTTGEPAGCFPLPGINMDGSTVESCGPTESLEGLYEQIGALAPNAQITVIGYPDIFGSPGKACHVGTALGLDQGFVSASDIKWLNFEGAGLNAAINKAVQAAQAAGVKITFVNPTSTFAGHGLCDTDTPWINGLMFSGKTPKKESFHPNTLGQDALASLLSGIPSF